MLKTLHIVGKQPMLTEGMRLKFQRFLFLSNLRSKEAPRFMLEILDHKSSLGGGRGRERDMALHSGPFCHKGDAIVYPALRRGGMK